MLEERVHLVPLQLVGDQRRDQVVDIRSRGDQGGDGLLAVVVPAPPARRRLDLLPAEDVHVQLGADRTRALAEDDPAAVGDRSRKAAGGVDERAHVDLGLGGERMERALHADVGLLQSLDPDLAGALEHRRVGPHIELDRVPSGRAQAEGRVFHSRPVYFLALPQPLQKVYR